jgi:hypothetical protein
MSENAEDHTPGPWEAGGLTRDRFVLPGETEGEGIFSMGDVNIFPPTGHAGPVAIAAGEANARLIAAAPELLAALIQVREIIVAGALTGFNCQSGDWATRLYESQSMSCDAVKKAGGKWRSAA